MAVLGYAKMKSRLIFHSAKVFQRMFPTAKLTDFVLKLEMIFEKKQNFFGFNKYSIMNRFLKKHILSIV